MYNAITIKTARGRGLYPNIIRYMAKTLIHSGIEEAFVDVDPSNIASIHGLEKAGYTRVVLIRMKKVFSTINYKLTVFDKDAWRQLSGIIKDFHSIKNIVDDN
jgi:RimJ/RimL family protein N-acetyltransferase